MALHRARKQFSNNNFQYIIEVDFRLDSFKKYIELTEKVIEKEVVQEIRKYEDLLKNSNEDDQEMLYSYEDPIIIKRHVSELYFNSIYVSLYSFLEKKMLQLCKLCEPKYSLKVNDLRGDGIKSFYNYLKKVVLLDLSAVNPEWVEIQKANKLRNQIVHSPQNFIEIRSQNQRLINKLKSIKNLDVKEEDDNFYYSINDKLVLLNFLKAISMFLRKIYYEKVSLES